MTTILQRDYWFGQVDSRPLSLFRIGFAMVLLKQVLYFIPVAQLFYSDEGLVPRPQFWTPTGQVGFGPFLLFAYVGSSWLAVLLFSGWAIIALALLVGYRTRLMTLLNYLYWLSLWHRNPFSLHAPDHVMLLLSFWSLFLPLNHHYAIDRWRMLRRMARTGGAIQTPLTAYAFPLRAIQIQIALIYGFTSYYKWQGLFWRTGDALFYALQQESFLSPFGLWLGTAAPLWLLRGLTWTTLLIEMSFAPLVFAPCRPGVKATGLLLATLLHIAIGIVMAIPDFSLVMVTSYLLFWEPSWVDKLLRQVRRRFSLIPMSPVVVCTNDPPALLRLQRVLVSLLLVILLVAAVWGGVAPENSVWNKAQRTQPPLLRALNQQLHLASPWAMFAYASRPRTGWLLIEGEWENGIRRLLYTNRMPATGQSYYLTGPGVRLRMFEQHLLWSFPEPILGAWGAYYCRLDKGQNFTVRGRLLAVRILRYYRWTHEPGRPLNPTAVDLLWRHQCTVIRTPSNGPMPLRSFLAP